MPQSLVQIYVHIVFSTSERIAAFSDPGMRAELHQYIAGTCRHVGSPAIRINGPEDHIHAICRLGKQCNPSDLVRDMKRASSHWINRKHPRLGKVQWQRGYGAFSLGYDELSRLIPYVEGQIEHHRKFSFKDEFRKLCKEAGIDIDERYVWE